MQQGAAWGRCGALFVLVVVVACGDPHMNTHNALVGGRVLVAPGVGLAHAHVEVDQVNLYDGKGEIRKHVGTTETDDDGYFAALPTGTINGLILIDASGGTFSDLVTGMRIQLDPSSHLKALHWLGIFEDRSTTMYVTPVHDWVEARFRYKMGLIHDTTKAVHDAYEHLNAHFGALDWETVIPADLTMKATSPIDEVRAAFVLGGIELFADDLRAASKSTSQVVNITTLLRAVEQDISDELLDGNDANSNVAGSGLQVGDCEPVKAGCSEPAVGCALGACRTLCDMFVNSYRSYLAGDVSKFIGSQVSPSVWNKTGLSTQDARALIDGIAKDKDPDLFADACFETADRSAPTIGWETSYSGGAVQDGDLISGTLMVRAVATDDTDAVPKVSFDAPVADSDGDPTNNIAVAMLDSRALLHGVDGALVVIARARDSAGNETVATRTFQVDNTPPTVTIDTTGIIVDQAGVWWTDRSGPTLQGTIADPHTQRVEIVIGGAVVATATITGMTWTAPLPPNTLTSVDNILTIRGIDSVGNVVTKTQTLRLDTTPPSVDVAESPVSDEANSTFQFLDDVPLGPRAEHAPHGVPVDLATNGSCPTLHKYVHLLSQPGPGDSHTVLGSSGVLNPVALNVVVSDDGVGIQPNSAEYRVGIQNGATINFLTEWTPLPPAAAGSPTIHHLPLYRDGAVGIPALGTTNGEYHVELRARDRFNRLGANSRCWTHVILAPPLRATTPSGEKGAGFARGLFSTKLNPAPGEFGDFAEKLLNANAAGAALWRWRAQNYIGEPVYVTVKISQGVQAQVNREFVIRTTLINPRPTSTDCGTPTNPTLPCTLSHPIDEYRSNFDSVVRNVALRARLFDPADREIMTCPGCTNDDATQTYVFQIPARSGGVTEYTFLTYLRPTIPAGQGTDFTMAPFDGNQPDTDPAPYSEVLSITGKLLGPPGTLLLCTDQENDNGTFVCIQKAVHQRYRALTRISFQLLDSLNTEFSSAATLSLPPVGMAIGTLAQSQGALTTDEGTLP